MNKKFIGLFILYMICISSLIYTLPNLIKGTRIEQYTYYYLSDTTSTHIKHDSISIPYDSTFLKLKKTREFKEGMKVSLNNKVGYILSLKDGLASIIYEDSTMDVCSTFWLKKVQ
jgi:hypothetical protein